MMNIFFYIEVSLNFLSFVHKQKIKLFFLTGTYRNCPSLRNSVANGDARTRSNGRSVRFSCNYAFTLIGNRYATCIRGRWDRDIPVCVSSNCPKLPEDARRKTAYSNENRTVDVSCDLGYSLDTKQTKSIMNLSANDSTARLYCISGVWNIESPNYLDYISPRKIFNPLSDQYPSCESKFFITKFS